MDFRIEWKSARKKKASASRREKAERSCYAALRLRDDRFDSIAAILIRLLASTAAPTNTSKRWRPSARSPSENSSPVSVNSLETNRSVCKFVSHDQDLQ